MNLNLKKRPPLFWALVALVTILILWVGSVIPRVIELRDAEERFLAGSIPVWTPPEPPPPEVALPDTHNIDWRRLSPHVDEHGIYVVDYDAEGQRGVRGIQRNPYNVAAFGIYSARGYAKSGDRTDLLLALRQFQFLAASARPVVVAGESTAVWCADFPLGYQYNATAPWRSSYFQIRCLDAMLWAAWLTGDPQYTQLAMGSIAPLGHPIEEGGLAVVTENGGLFFQEVVTTPAHHILNGHLTTLISLYYFAAYTGSAEARQIFERGVQGTLDFLPNYDKHGYSLYSLSPNPGLKNHFNIANPTYHQLHVSQLRTLHELTGNAVFKQYAETWHERSSGLFDTAWTGLFIMFKDVMRLKRAL